MLFFKKKKVADKTKDDRELVAENSKAVDALIILAENDEEIVNELRLLQEKLKYLIPSGDEKVFGFDKTIKGKLGDLRIVLVKAEENCGRKAMQLITDIKVVIADRQTKR